MPDWLKKTLAFLAAVLGILIIVAVVMEIFFVDRVTVANNSMAPTIMAGDIVLMWRGAELEQNDVALCKHPRDPNRYVIGRVMGFPGNTIEHGRGGLLINGRRITTDWKGERRLVDPAAGRNERWLRAWEELSDYEGHWMLMQPNRILTIPVKHVRTGLFLMSDHRYYRGEDSRAFGDVPKANCVGEIFMVLWPTDNAGADFPASERRFDIID